MAIAHSCRVPVPPKLIPTSETVTCRRQPRPAVPEPPVDPPPERVALPVSPSSPTPRRLSKDKSLHKEKVNCGLHLDVHFASGKPIVSCGRVYSNLQRARSRG
ncbi:unnamed protein product [Pleuronectes platessa]|uniref:Uncharacterized protein n=1 Tax=Pleuronectes platessa TaxID=8262 RepID=A0A9N7VLE4_PLEPL|nr:unnamed protein product [Pleuronectes platessa]